MDDIRFPGALIMLSKVLFTLDGILHDIGGSESRMGLTIARNVTKHWLSNRKAFRSPLNAIDWMTLQSSAVLLASRLLVRGEQALLDRFLPAGAAAAGAGP
jgi:hypothetical protein